MAKEAKPVFLKVIIIAAVILIANLAFLFYFYGSLKSGMTGFSVLGSFSKAYAEMPYSSKIFIVAEWSILILILAGTFIRDVSVKRGEIEGINLKDVSGKIGTDIDKLYSILQDKNQLRISTISKAFKVDKETAMEWCRILESGNLASMDYPGVGEPVLRINKKEENN